jgi:hypothetical protein
MNAISVPSRLVQNARAGTRAISVGHNTRNKVSGWTRVKSAHGSRMNSQNSFKRRTSMSKTRGRDYAWQPQYQSWALKHADTTPQKAIDRLRKAEAQEDIREALAAPQEATNGR